MIYTKKDELIIKKEKDMIVLAVVYLYKFHLKPRFTKLGSITRPQLSRTLQPVTIRGNNLVNV
ncbi:MAG: hypothetical protein JWP44_2776 [Mucilaginibacter sp.]|nr:hypothetical protein [Mucilaginibacter sp.]